MVRKNGRKIRTYLVALLSVLFLFGTTMITVSDAWARAGGGGSSGSRGSRSFSAPRAPSGPSSPSPGLSAPGRTSPGSPFSQPSGGFTRNPFVQGLAGGLVGGMIGNMLFGGTGHAATGGGHGGGIGLLDILIIGLLVYFGWKFFKKRRIQQSGAGYSDGGSGYSQGDRSNNATDTRYSGGYPDAGYGTAAGELDRGFQQIRQYDPDFDVEALKEKFQDMFFRIQAGWMNLSLSGIEHMLTREMADFFTAEFDKMRRQGVVNRLENIAIRRVEPSEAWQESGREYVTALFTANLLDYTVDAKTGQVVGGDKLNPVKFQEFWTFTRDIGSSQWKLSAINQAEGDMQQQTTSVGYH